MMTSLFDFRVSNSGILISLISREQFHMKIKNKYCMERKKRRSGSNKMILIQSNISISMILVHSNVSKTTH